MRKRAQKKTSYCAQRNSGSQTLYVGDGINDAPSMMAATVGIAIGQNSDVTAEAAAGVVIMDNSLEKVDEFMHIARRMRIIALQSAVGGMVLSLYRHGFCGNRTSKSCKRRNFARDYRYPLGFKRPESGNTA